MDSLVLDSMGIRIKLNPYNPMLVADKDPSLLKGHKRQAGA